LVVAVSSHLILAFALVKPAKLAGELEFSLKVCPFTPAGNS
jgi:hypothetical protein